MARVCPYAVAQHEQASADALGGAGASSRRGDAGVGLDHDLRPHELRIALRAPHRPVARLVAGRRRDGHRAEGDGHASERHRRRLLHQVRGVVGEDPVAQRQPLQLAQDLGIRPVQPDVARQRARLAGGPELLDVPAGAGVTAEGGVRRKPLLMAASPSRDRHGPLSTSGAAVPPEHHELVVGEQVGESLRLQIVQLDAVGAERQVGEHGRRDLRRQGAHGLLDVAAGPDVLGDTAGALCEPLEHVRVDVIPDTERKDPKRATAAVCLVGDALGIGLTHRRHPVGQEDHDAERAFGGGRRECLRQRPGDVRAALGRDRPDPLLRVADVLGRPLCPRGRVPPHIAAEGDQPEPVPCAQRAEQLHQRRLGLVELLPGHRARHVEHGDDVAMQRHRLRRPAGREQQHEVAVLAGRLVAHERHPQEAASQRQEHLEIAARRRVGERQLEPVAAAVEGESVRGRVGIAEARGAVDLEPEAV